MKKTWGIICAVLMLCVVLCACQSATAPVVAVGEDQVMSLYSAVGERQVTGSGSEVNTDYEQKTVSYADVTAEDLTQYAYVLKDAGFLVTKNTGDTLQLGMQSVTQGKIVLVDMGYPQDGAVTITYTVAEGTITPSEE